jgi:hypothetical protein
MFDRLVEKVWEKDANAAMKEALIKPSNTKKILKSADLKHPAKAGAINIEATLAIALTHCVQIDVAKVFYKVLQGAVIVQSWIAPDDKDFTSQFDSMCLASTVWIFKFHEQYGGKAAGKFNAPQLG